MREQLVINGKAYLCFIQLMSSMEKFEAQIGKSVWIDGRTIGICTYVLTKTPLPLLLVFLGMVDSRENWKLLYFSKLKSEVDSRENKNQL